MKYPQKLYKYQPFSNYSLQNLKNNCLYFNHPEDFNDPYDTTHEVVIKNLNLTTAKDLFFGDSPERKMFECIENHTADLSTILQIVDLLRKSFLGFNNNLIVSFGCTESELASYIANNQPSSICSQIASAFYSALDHTVQKSMGLIRSSQFSTKGVCCFSEEVDNLLMWSYYADGHKGFCLEFDTSYDPFTKLHKVNYVQNAPEVDANNIFTENHDHTGIIETYLLTKFQNWSHEKEWRVFHHNSRQEFIYKSPALTGVHFGSKMPLSQVEILVLIIREQNKYCKFYRMSRNPGTFHVTPHCFTYTSFREAKELVQSYIGKKLNTGVRDVNDLIKGISIQEIGFPIDEAQLSNIVQAIIDDHDHAVKYSI